MSTSDVAARARAAVIAEIRRRGGAAEEKRVGRRTEIQVTARDDSPEQMLRVLSKTSGDWQTRTTEGDARATTTNRYWVFVDLGPPSPHYFIAPEDWVRRDIYDTHQEYLRQHGGRRAVTPDSLHHAIRPSRVSEWLDRWDLLGLR